MHYVNLLLNFICPLSYQWTLWVDKTNTIFEQLSCKWYPDKMDVLLALIPKENAFGAVHGGDYHIIDGVPSRKKKEEKEANYLYTGIQILHPHIFSGIEQGVFSLVRLYDKAEQSGRLHAIVFDGNWYHVGTPEALTDTEKRLSK